jgi:hypothetical protein
MIAKQMMCEREIGLRLPKAEIASLDKRAKANGYTRSEAIRVLILRSLKG